MTSAPRPVSLLAAALLLPLLNSCASSTAEPFDVVEATITEMQQAMAEGRVTSRELIEAHLLRIALYEEDVNAVVAINHNALAIADSLDRLRAEGRVLGPLHGIPVALKDNSRNQLGGFLLHYRAVAPVTITTLHVGRWAS